MNDKGDAEFESSRSSPRRDLVAGLIAGGASIFTGFPFDTLKVRLQAEPGVYRGALHCLVHILRHEGVMHGLYRGLTPPLIGGALETSVNYYVFHRTLHFLKEWKGCGVREMSVFDVAIAGGVAGVFLSPVLGPFELIKCRMQIAKGSRFRHPMECLRWTIQREGLWGLTRGTGATMIREVPGNSLLFTCYEILRRSLPGRPKDPTVKFRSFGEIVGDATSAIVCGGLAGMFMWLIVLPLDVAKTRLQAASTGEKYDIRITKQLMILWMEGKWRALYSGLVPILIRAFPANAAQWLMWEIAIEQLRRRFEQDPTSL